MHTLHSGIPSCVTTDPSCKVATVCKDLDLFRIAKPLRSSITWPALSAFLAKSQHELDFCDADYLEDLEVLAQALLAAERVADREIENGAADCVFHGLAKSVSDLLLLARLGLGHCPVQVLCKRAPPDGPA